MLPQTGIASQASDRHSPFTGVAQWSPGRRRELWRRLLATQPAAEYSSLDAEYEYSPAYSDWHSRRHAFSRIQL